MPAILDRMPARFRGVSFFFFFYRVFLYFFFVRSTRLVLVSVNQVTTDVGTLGILDKMPDGRFLWFVLVSFCSLVVVVFTEFSFGFYWVSVGGPASHDRLWGCQRCSGKMPRNVPGLRTLRTRVRPTFRFVPTGCFVVEVYPIVPLFWSISSWTTEEEKTQ